MPSRACETLLFTQVPRSMKFSEGRIQHPAYGPPPSSAGVPDKQRCLGASTYLCPLHQAAEDEGTRHYQHEEHHHQDQAYRQQNHQRCLARGRGVHLADTHDGQIQPVEGQ